jgi:formylglycine-generating enzyme required for sulfatase activity
MSSAPPPSDSQCLTEELLAELVDGHLIQEARDRANHHAARCSPCRELLVTIVRGNPPEKGNEPALSGPALFPAPELRPMQAVATWVPPTEFDEFCLVRPLGHGAMGVVYLAHDQTLDRQVAVKFIASNQPDARVLSSFQTEARAIARLQHPNVVTVFRVGEVQGRPYIVSEYLEGKSLSDLALPLPWRRALGLGVGLARGLVEAHRQGVLHRDVKPSNVLLTTEGEVKLLDFGLAALGAVGDTVGLSGVRAPAGTPLYMAPELFAGTAASPRSDLYALGLILYELCTGTLPMNLRVPAASQAEQGTANSAESSRHGSASLIARVPGIDPDFAALIERCLRVDPEERFATAEALCAELERLHKPDVLSEGNPYRGLSHFEAEHRALFFGRDADIRAVLERLRRQPLVLVAGDSGIGKSSLCRAGILPRVEQGALDEFRDFSTLTLVPGQRPLSALAAALAPVLGKTEAELGAQLAESPGQIGPILRAAYQNRRGLLLFVDQLEELITVSEPAQAERFASLLDELALPSSGVRVLLAVRGDFLTRVGGLPGLGGVVERALYLLRALTQVGVREAIVGPARSSGVVFESQTLIQTLTAAMEQGTGGLPLLQFALAELWERRDLARGVIPQMALTAMGGVAGALSQHADSVLARLTPAEQQAARGLLGRLITAEGTRSERREEELIDTSQEARTALRTLVQGRLLHARTVAGQASYEIAHEALITNWGTLRNWLDEDVGQRALRQRLELAGAEWERLGRADDQLWRGRLLDEAETIEVTALEAREQDFLRASRRVMRHQSLLRWAVMLLIVLAGGASYGGLRLQRHLETKRFIDEKIAAARDALNQGRDLGKSATAHREKAIKLFTLPGPAELQAQLGAEDLSPLAEETWTQTLRDLTQAEAAFTEAERALEDALERPYDHSETRNLLFELTYDRLLLAERFHRPHERALLARRLERPVAKDTKWGQELQLLAQFELETIPPGASVELTRYEADDTGVRRRKPVPGLGTLGPTPIARLKLPAGSYHLRLTREGHVTVDFPLLLERGAHEKVHLALPTTVPEGYVYIPPGCFQSGSADVEKIRKFEQSPPLHHHCLQQGYLIGRTEVTLDDWIEYLETLPRGAPDRRILEGLPDKEGLTLRQLPSSEWDFALHMAGLDPLTARDGEPLRYPARNHGRDQNWRRLPLVGVSANDLTNYLAWLDRSGRLPGARLCSEPEWIRAARGADDRRYPHGDELQKAEANIDSTYGRKAYAFGPDAVGSHPTSDSPFGLHDMAGNAFEITRAVTPDLGETVLKGGAWYYTDGGASIATRQAFPPTYRDFRVGVRLCASF